MHYGYLSNNESAPVINNGLEVERSKEITCFDAVFFRTQGYILIDCAEKLPVKDDFGNSYRNLFFYLKIETA